MCCAIFATPVSVFDARVVRVRASVSVRACVRANEPSKSQQINAIEIEDVPISENFSFPWLSVCGIQASNGQSCNRVTV